MKILYKYTIPITIIIVTAIILIVFAVTSIRTPNITKEEQPKDTAGLANQIADEMPKLLKSYPPQYPKIGKMNNMECQVFAKVLIDTSGNPIKAEILKREGGVKEFEDSVIVSVMRSKFVPAKMKGKSVEAWVVLPYRFRLQ